MSIKPKTLKKVITLLVLMGFIFPIKAPVSSAKAKLCCMSKGHCMMGKASGTKISAMGQSKSAKMIACCEDNCLSCSDTSVLHPRLDLSAQNVGLSSTHAPIISIAINHSFFDTGPPNLGPRNFPSTFRLHSPPIFKLNSSFLL